MHHSPEHTTENTPVDFTHPHPTLKRPIRRVALACIPCRSRKVKCDATLPNCIRCSTDEKTCEYQKSRRGGRPRRPVTVPLQVAVEHSFTSVPQYNTEQWSEKLGTTANNRSFAHTSSSSGSGPNSTGSSTHSVADSHESVSRLDSITLDDTHLTRTQIDQLLSQYFAFFHVSHPCVLPKWALRLRLASEPIASEVLLPVLLYIGSIFTYTVDTAPLATAARQAIDSARLQPGPPNPFYVQARLLYAIATYASNEPERGRELLGETIRDALSLGMHRAEFASQRGQLDPVLEESWRRTWWSIYIADASISGSAHAYPTRTGSAQSTADLPCEEQQYESGVSPDHD